MGCVSLKGLIILNISSGYLAYEIMHMEKLVAREAEYDFVCPAHNGSPLNKRYIKDYIALDDQLLAGTAQEMPNAAGYGMGPVGMGGRKNTRVQNGGASFVYSDAWK